MRIRLHVLIALAVAAPSLGCIVLNEEPIGATEEAFVVEPPQSSAPMTPTDAPLEPPPLERTPQKMPVRARLTAPPVLPLSAGALVLGQIASCRQGSNAAAMRCMASVLSGQGGG